MDLSLRVLIRFISFHLTVNVEPTGNEEKGWLPLPIENCLLLNLSFFCLRNSSTSLASSEPHFPVGGMESLKFYLPPSTKTKGDTVQAGSGIPLTVSPLEGVTYFKPDSLCFVTFVTVCVILDPKNSLGLHIIIYIRNEDFYSLPDTSLIIVHLISSLEASSLQRKALNEDELPF